MGNWNFDEIENSLVSDAEKRITRGYTGDGGTGAAPSAPSDATAPARGQSLGSVPMPTDSPQAAERPQADAADIIGVKCGETKGVQTYLPLADYMRLLQQKTLRKQNIAHVAGVAIIDWLDRQEQSAPTSGKK
jgi:hypothetical protein